MQKLRDEQVAAVAKAVNSGATSIRSAARDLGVDESTLRRRVRKHLGRPAAPGLDSEQEIPVIVRDYSSFESLRVYPMGDFHIGSPYHAQAKLEEWINYIVETPNATILNTGDNLNSAILGAKSDVYAERYPVQTAMEQFEERFEPVADAGRLDVLTGGNHEARIYRAVGIDVMRVVARDLGVPHYEGAAVILYKVGGERYIFWVRHGTGNAPASMNAVTAAGYVALADVYLTGHTHRQNVVLDDFFLPEGLDSDEPRMIRSPRRYVTSGSFVRYERYAAERGYAPSHLGAPRIFLDGTRHDFHVSI